MGTAARVRARLLAPDQVELISELQSATVAEAAYRRGIDRRTIRQRVLAAAEYLESLGQPAGDLRALVSQRPGRTVTFSALTGTDRHCAVQWFGAAAVAPAAADRRKVRSAFAARRARCGQA